MLSKKAQYSLYALRYLSRDYPNSLPVLIGSIADAEKIPKKFLEAILIDLKTLGIVNSRKGKGGGYYLIKEPSQVSLIEIIRHFDGAIALIPCVSDKYYEKCRNCNDELNCGIRAVMRDVRDKTVDILSSYTLADFLISENMLRNMKKI